MSHKTVTVTIETHQRLQELKQRIIDTDPVKLPENIRTLIAKGTTSCSVVGLALELLEQRLDEIEQQVPATRKPKKKIEVSSIEGEEK